MSNAIYLGASGAVLQQLRLDTISNNLANVDTAGFKKELALFRMPEAGDPQGLATPAETGEPAMLPYMNRTSFAQGPLKVTGNPLDIALEGKGFFTVETPEGERYTRQGHFMLDGENQLVTPDGYPVLGEGGAIAIGEGTVTVDGEGNVAVDGQIADRLRIVEFEQPHPLQRVGSTLFQNVNPDAEGAEAEQTTVVQGSLEMANTDVVTAMTQMIESHRLFEAYQKVIQTTDDMDKRASTTLGRID